MRCSQTLRHDLPLQNYVYVLLIVLQRGLLIAPFNPLRSQPANGRKRTEMRRPINGVGRRCDNPTTITCDCLMSGRHARCPFVGLARMSFVTDMSVACNNFYQFFLLHNSLLSFGQSDFQCNLPTRLVCSLLVIFATHYKNDIQGV